MLSSDFEEAMQRAVEPGPGRLLSGVTLAAASIKEGERNIFLVVLEQYQKQKLPCSK